MSAKNSARDSKQAHATVPKVADFPYALKSFLGYLEGTQKAAHTIKNYRLDLLSFQSFIETELAGKPVKLASLTSRDLEQFHDHLKAQGLKTNTRRRKLLTVQRFINYLTNRNKLPVELAKKLPTPHKVERVPFTVPYEALLGAIRKLPSETVLDARNRALLWTLTETGCQVSEVTRLKFDQWEEGAESTLRIQGKSSRSLPVSRELIEAVMELRGKASQSEWIFLGFNKFGSLGAPISPRGVELLVRMYSARLGYPQLVPRTFRHSAVLNWFKQGLSRNEIRERLGLRTEYAFRVFEPLLTTSVAS